ncbi:conserved protein of unknown function, putative exported protein [Methylorubrum extorquens]|uniref:Sulfur globule protein n=1 Tax=Methylorubrum extorquens TaxID=408 RepID=A0A2N9ASW9_METEX|nr:conserved protein of unknown function, putative exported protein [Methylorubrum extorquens]
MLRKPTLTLLSVLAFAGGILGTTSAAMADPPWARGGGRGFHHGGPPPWAPAHGWRRKHDFGGYGGRSYRSSRYDDGRRYDRYGY